jgi:uncharacterized protein (DUF305 family)
MRRVSMLLAVLLLLGGCGRATPGPAAPAGATPGAGPAAATPGPAGLAAGTSGAGSRHTSVDVAFGQALIPHHRQGIALASSVARQPGARTLAEAIIVTQQDEVARLSGWLREWSATVPPSAAPSPAAKDPVRALIAHQQEAIKLAQSEQAGGANPAALAFAKQIVESRAEEIAQLRTYLG